MTEIDGWLSSRPSSGNPEAMSTRNGNRPTRETRETLKLVEKLRGDNQKLRKENARLRRELSKRLQDLDDEVQDEAEKQVQRCENCGTSAMTLMKLGPSTFVVCNLCKNRKKVEKSCRN